MGELRWSFRRRGGAGGCVRDEIDFLECAGVREC